MITKAERFYAYARSYSEVIVPALFVLWVVAAWMTHVIVCLKTASWGFLIAGALFFPVAWVHGTGIWFGAW